MAAPGVSRSGAAPRMPVHPPEHPPDTEDAVPVFGSWRRIHAAVALSALAVMALLLLFSRWPY
jgi:hypothetical protein